MNTPAIQITGDIFRVEDMFFAVATRRLYHWTIEPPSADAARTISREQITEHMARGDLVLRNEQVLRAVKGYRTEARAVAEMRRLAARLRRQTEAALADIDHTQKSFGTYEA